MARHTVLSTKKISSFHVDEAAKNDIEIMEQAFIAVTPIISEEKTKEILAVVLEAGQQFVAFTSANAVETVKQQLRQGATWLIPNWKVFCISEKTKEALHPFINADNIVATAAYGADLAQKIIENGVTEIVFFCGDKRRDELPQILKEAGINVREIIVYETVETPVVTTDKIDAILFFSPSAVQSFFTLNQLKNDTVCFAIGDTTAAAIADFTDNRIITSEATSVEIMMTAVTQYFKQKDISNKA